MIRLGIGRIIIRSQFEGVSNLIPGLRHIFVASRQRGKKRDNSSNEVPVEQRYLDRLELQKEAEYNRKIKEIRGLTTKVSRLIQKRQDETKKLQKIADLPLPSDVDQDTNEIYQAITAGEPVVTNPGNAIASSSSSSSSSIKPFNPSSSSLITPVVNLPKSIEQRLGLSVKFLLSESHQNWPLILQSLKISGGFNGLDKEDVRRFITRIPKSHLPSVIPQIESLLDEINLKTSRRVMNSFIESLSLGSTISPSNLERIEHYVEKIRLAHWKGKLPKETHELLIKVYGKVNDMDKINSILLEMKENNLTMSPTIYKNILKTLVYKSKNHKEAVSVFDTMNFLSVETKPGTEAYKDIIVSYVNDNNIEKALDLYQEMLNSKTPINQEILVALARGCISNKTLKFKAWEFIFEIYDNKWTPTLQTLEYILYLSAKDGDVAMSRALYKRIADIKSPSKRSFTFLLLSYSKSKILTNNNEPFPILFNNRGKNFRENLIATSFNSPMNNLEPKYQIPLLPLDDLVTPNQIMAESSAVWAHALVFMPEFIHIDAYNTYLNIAAEIGSFEEFKERYNFSKLIEDSAINKTRIIVEEPNDDKAETVNYGDESDIEFEKASKAPLNELTTSPLLSEISQQSTSIKITRTTLTYVIALKAAGRFRDYKFAKTVWEERGKYRKSKEFRSMNINQKDKYDFQFANEMVQVLTKMGFYDDALSIIISTEYQFKWSWSQLGPLYEKCVEIGKDKVPSTLRNIAKRAQIRFEGKIRRRDYKEYVMKKGY